jgi:hypothetical protein
MKKLLVLIAALCLSAAAADISGTWKGSAETPNGTIERTFVFKVDGTTLTGKTTSQMMGESEIKNGKVEGDNVTFNITINFGGNEMTLTYKGKVSGETIKFTVEIPGGDQTIVYNVKKVS